MKKYLLWMLLSGILSGNGFAQRQITNNTNGWFMYFGDHKISNHWGIHLEAQFRRNQIITHPQQLLLRTGINYHFNPNVFATVGYGFVETYPYGEFASKRKFPESRIWEQIQIKNQIEKFEVVNRLRLEQRLVKSPVLNGTEYGLGDATFTSRMRILNRVSVPFKGKTIVDKSWYFSAYDEVMLSFGKNVALNIFDQNRAYLAIGYKIPKVGRLEVGYLNQLILKSDGKRVENNNTLQVGLSSTIDFYKKK